MQIRTFSCEKVRKLPLAGLDPSMLLGFLVRDEAEWRDLRARVVEVSPSQYINPGPVLIWYSSANRTARYSASKMNRPRGRATRIAIWASRVLVSLIRLMGFQVRSSLCLRKSKDRLLTCGIVGGDVKVVREDPDSDEDADGDFFDASEGRPRSFVEVPARADSSASSAGTEEDPADPLTPGPHTSSRNNSFDLRALQIKAVPSDYSEISNETFESTRDGPLDDDEGELIGDEEWEDVDGAGTVPFTPTSNVHTNTHTTRPEPRERVETVRPEPRERVETVRPERIGSAEGRERERMRTERSPSAVKVASRQASESSTYTTSSVASTASSTSKREKSGSSSREKDKDGSKEKDSKGGEKKGKKKKSSVPVPFPSASEDVEEERERRVPQMSDRRGRDGGRTQSGGVRGILNEDL